MSNAGQLLTLDTLLNVINIDSIPLFLSLYYNIMYPDFEHLYLTGHLTVPFSNPRTDLLVIMRMDSSKVILDTAYLGPADTINYPGYLKNLDFVDLSNLYFGGTCNQALGTFSTNKSYYLLGKLSPSLDILWQKFYGGDMYYNLWSLLATSDHGCILMGSFNDYATMGMQRDMLIIKVDSTGVLTSVQGNDNLVLHDLIAYPNPGQDRLILEFGPQVSGSDFVLSDLNGKEVLVIKLNNSPQIVDAQKLKQGLYVWKVLSRGNLVDSGKWIKKE